MTWSQWWSFNATFVEHDVDLLGVYELSDENKNTVYYGSGKLKSRLQDHLNKKECPLARYYRLEYVTGEEECRKREEELLSAYKAVHEKLPMYNGRIG